MLLVVITLPTVALLYLQNKKVQTAVSEYFIDKAGESLGININVSSVHYSFFKRLQVYDLYLEDQFGDTLIYAEVAKIRVKKFRPDKKDIQLKYIMLENSLLNIVIHENRLNSMKFFIDSLRNDLPPEEKQVINIEKMAIQNGRFALTAPHKPNKPGGIDFTDLKIGHLNLDANNFIIQQDTIYMNVKKVSGIESSGFIMDDVSFHLNAGKQFLTFYQSKIITPDSYANVPMVNFEYTIGRNFRYFYDSIDLYIESKNSHLNFADVGYFFPELRNLNGNIYLDGTIYGKPKNLQGKNINIAYKEFSQLEFDMDLSGLPANDSSNFRFDIKNFQATPDEMSDLLRYYEPGKYLDTIYYPRVDSIRFNGIVDFSLNGLQSQGQLTSNLGELNYDISGYANPDNQMKFAGDLYLNDFDMGKMLDAEDLLQEVTLGIHCSGVQTDDNLNAKIFGAIDTLSLLQYEYKSIDFKGIFNDGGFDGELSVNDQNIQMNLSGNIALNEKTKNGDFNLEVTNLNPYALNLRKVDPELRASFSVNSSLAGTNLDDLNGRIELFDGYFRRDDEKIDIDIIDLKILNQPDSSSVTLDSDPFHADIRGNYKFSDLPGKFITMVNNHIDIIPTKRTIVNSKGSFTYLMEVKDANEFMSFFFPDLTLGNNSNISGFYKTENNEYLSMNSGYFSSIGFSDIVMQEMKFSAASDTNALSVRLDGEELSLGESFQVSNPEISTTIKNNTTRINMFWENDSLPEYSGNIQTHGLLQPKSDTNKINYRLTVYPSTFVYDNQRFDIQESNLVFSAEGYEADSLIILGENQSFTAFGSYTNLENDSITAILNNLDLELINRINKSIKPRFNGFVSGNASFKKESGRALFYTDLHAENISINAEPIGNADLLAKWNDKKQEISFNIRSNTENTNIIYLDGAFKPSNENINATLNLQNINLSAIEDYTSELLTDLSGTGNVSLLISGSINEPVLNGSISVKDFSGLINETKTKYSIDDDIIVENSKLLFENFIISDEYSAELMVYGNIDFGKIENPVIDIFASAENFNYLSTTRNDNQQVYGDIYATTIFNVNGPFDDINIEIAASTEKNTNLKIPLFTPEEARSSDFIRFINDDIALELSDVTSQEVVKKERQFTIDMELAVTSDASMQLIFDPSVGDIIQASGNGDLKIEMLPSGDINIYGDVTIDNGEYLFTLQNVINKRFKIKPGGTFSWNGSPTDVMVDFEAIYETKASTYSLAPEPTEGMKKRIPVQCLLALQGDLNNPTITPSIFLPTAEPETRSIVETSIGTEEELMRQFISLLVINNFISAGSENNPQESTPGLGLPGVTASELLSNQLSNWLSQISSDFDIGVNYRPGDNISSDEVEVALSTQILNDRIIFRGNLDVVGDEVTTTTGEASNIVGDFDLEFRLTDKVSLKAFNRVNDDRVIRPSLYTQGVGVIYRSEFNKLSDIFRNKKAEQPTGEDKLQEKDAAIREEE